MSTNDGETLPLLSTPDPLKYSTGANSMLKDAGVSKAGAGHIPSLDGLRAVSIVLVLIGHAVGRDTWFGPHGFALRAIFLHSELGVRVFFVISGFLITSLLINERSRFGAISLRLFYIRRALRILPAFFLFIGVVAILGVLGVVRVPGWYWLYVLTYTVNFAPVQVWVLGHIWSLSVEEQFYLLWPLAMKIARPRTCVVIAVIAIFASPAVHVADRLAGIHLPSAAFPFQCGPIAMGCLLAIWAREVRRMIVSSKFLSDGRTLLSTLVLIALLDAIPKDLGSPIVFLTIFLDFLLTLCIARLMFIPTGVAGRFLNSAPVVLIGKLSYSLYLWQELFLNPYSRAPIALPFPVNYLAMFGVASASYWGLETRFVQLRKRFRKQAQPSVLV